MADHTINVSLDGDNNPVVKDENNSDTTTGHFWQTFVWNTTLDSLSVNFKDGDPFWLQDLPAAHGGAGARLSVGPVTVINPFKNTYPYGVTVSSHGVSYSNDPKVIIDGNMKFVAVALASIIAVGALALGLGILGWGFGAKLKS